MRRVKGRTAVWWSGGAVRVAWLVWPLDGSWKAPVLCRRVTFEGAGVMSWSAKGHKELPGAPRGVCIVEGTVLYLPIDEAGDDTGNRKAP
jgi:hypothetical protein